VSSGSVPVYMCFLLASCNHPTLWHQVACFVVLVTRTLHPLTCAGLPTCRASLESDRRSLTDQVTTLRSQLAGAERQVASLQHSDTALRRELAAANRAAVQLSAAESRAATLLEALEGAEAALRTSQSQSTKLLQVSNQLFAVRQLSTIYMCKCADT
jgi:septal ring factor EnvC (AmiA/AmiB activator)